MKRMNTGTRIALVLTMWSATTLLGLRVFGVFGDGHRPLLQSRTRLCENVAVSCSEFSSRHDDAGVDMVLAAFVTRNSDVLSAAIRNSEGDLTHQSGPHDRHWTTSSVEKMSSHLIYVPVLRGREPIGQVEVSFVPLMRNNVWGFVNLPSIKVIVLTALINLVTFSMCLRRCFRFLDPNQVVPDRVRTALDTVAEGLLILSNRGSIVLANRSFAKVVDQPIESLQGKKMSNWQWRLTDEVGNAQRLLWDQSVTDEDSEPRKISLQTDTQGELTFLVNSTAIRDDEKKVRGRLVSLNDITVVENKNSELQAALVSLRKSQDEINEQNKKLKFLATRDPMTGCLNRRSFFQSFKEHWKASRRYGYPLSCVMVDVDHFKSINDTYGHSVGDEVLKQVASTLRETARETDLVCRYGGEEFCILLPHVGLEGGIQAAERFRQAIATLEFDDFVITASLGVTDEQLEAANPEELIDQADRCLYVAKRNGRNQVVSFDPSRTDETTDIADGTPSSETAPASSPSASTPDINDVMTLVDSLTSEASDVSNQSDQVGEICQALVQLLADSSRAQGGSATIDNHVLEKLSEKLKS